MLNQVNRLARFGVNNKMRNQSVVSIITTLLIWLTVSWLTLFNRFENVDLWLSDIAAVYFEESYENEGVVIVAIDTPSFQNSGLAWPWPRSQYADLLDATKQAGAKAAIFDIVFDQATPKDSVFAAAIERFGAVVLAAEHSAISTPQGSIETTAFPVSTLMEAASGVGIASFPLDRDGRVRRLPVSNDVSGHSLVSASVKLVQSDKSELKDKDRYIRYVGGMDLIPVVSFYQALNPQEMLPEGFLKDKTLMIGLSLSANPDVQSFVGDEVLVPRYGSIALGHNNGRVPGVYVQALALNTVLGQQSLLRAPYWLEILLGVGAFISSLFSAWCMKKYLKRAILITCFSVVLLILFTFLSRANSIVLMIAPAFIAVLIAGIFQTIYAGMSAYLERRKLVAGFGKYVAPQILKEILDSDTPPILGGEMREVSVIVTDLEGYTALMEFLSPEKGAQVLREYLALMGQTILDHGGMIDQFIGDSVVAIFNAPTHQADHSDRALKCIKALEVCSSEFHKKYVALGLPMGRTRIGAHIGVANVGNFGSEDRFHYTAIGEVVNVAARLEAANKTSGTLVLVSQALIDAAKERGSFLPIGEMSVYGKLQLIEVFTSSETLESSDIAIYYKAYDLLEKGDTKAITLLDELRTNNNIRAIEYLSRHIDHANITPPKIIVEK